MLVIYGFNFGLMYFRMILFWMVNGFVCGVGLLEGFVEFSGIGCGKG